MVFPVPRFCIVTLLLPAICVVSKLLYLVAAVSLIEAQLGKGRILEDMAQSDCSSRPQKLYPVYAVTLGWSNHPSS